MAGPVSKARIRPLAANDLEDIVRYLDGKSETAGDHFLQEFVHAMEMLSEMPRLGTVRRKRGRLKGVRYWPLTSFGPYLIFYLPHQDGIEALRIFHGARNIELQLRNGLE